MNVENFAQWLRLQGYRVVRTPSSYWYERALRLYQAFPYHWTIAPSDEELDEFISQQGALGLRYSAPIEDSQGRISYHAIYEGNDYGFDKLGKWARKNVRRGLKNCRVEPVAFERIAEEGWGLQLDTLKRQARRTSETHDQWRRRFLAARDIPGFEAWGALVNGKLAASVATFRMEDFYYMLYQQCQGDYLAAHVNNALSFTVSQALLSRARTRGIFYSLESFDAPDSMDQFKFRMGYRAKAVRQNVVFSPWLRPMINALSHSILKSIQRRFPENGNLAKAEGMIRFYLEGRKPIETQDLPAVLQADWDSETDPSDQLQPRPVVERLADEIPNAQSTPKPVLE